jgi:ProP effector
LLAETWPACFCVYERRRRPLQLGIHRDILAALGGAVTEEELSRALRYYTGNAWFLRAMVAGAARISLDGNPAGTVTPEEAATATVRLANRKRKRPPSPIPTAPSPQRISLADLRREAQARKAREAAAAEIRESEMKTHFRSKYDTHDEFYALVDLLRPGFGNWDAFDPVARAILDIADSQTELADAFDDDAHCLGNEAAFTAAVEKRYAAGRKLIVALEDRGSWPDPELGQRD